MNWDGRRGVIVGPGAPGDKKPPIHPPIHPPSVPPLHPPLHPPVFPART
jgi:hypothetical protein